MCFSNVSSKSYHSVIYQTLLIKKSFLLILEAQKSAFLKPAQSTKD